MYVVKLVQFTYINTIFTVQLTEARALSCHIQRSGAVYQLLHMMPCVIYYRRVSKSQKLIMIIVAIMAIHIRIAFSLELPY